MKDLAVRIEALDADAGAALRVIASFDSLTESRAGLQAIVRGAAVLAGVPARLDDAERRVHVRITPAGVSAASAEPADAGWPRTVDRGQRVRVVVAEDPPAVDQCLFE